MTRIRTDDPRAHGPIVEYVSSGEVPGAVESYARAKVARLYHLAPGRVTYARVTVTRLAGRGSGRHCAADGVLDVGGRLIRAHLEATNAFEAVDLLQHRLRDQVVGLHERHRGA